MMEVYSELQLVLDFEVIDENTENNEQRVRRKNPAKEMAFTKQEIIQCFEINALR